MARPDVLVVDNKMISIQDCKNDRRTFQRNRSNLFPKRLTQPTSTSYDNFIRKSSKLKSCLSQICERHKEQHHRQAPISKLQAVTLTLKAAVQAPSSVQRSFQNTSISTDILYNSKKARYINFIKTRHQTVKIPGDPPVPKNRPFSVFNFSQRFFYQQLNLIKRKKKNPSPSSHQGKRVKSQFSKGSEVLVFGPRNITKKECKKITQFFDIEEPDESIEAVEDNYKQKSQFHQTKKSILRKTILSRQPSKGDHLSEDYSPFKGEITKKIPFVFGLNDKPIENKNRQKLILYHDFLWKINYSNGLFVRATPKDYCFKAYVGLGNNSNLIKCILKRRFWWAISDSADNCNLVWTQLKINQFFSSQPNSQNNINDIYRSDFIRQDEGEKGKPEAKIFNQRDLASWTSYYDQYQKSQTSLNEKIFKKRGVLVSLRHVKKIQNSEHIKVCNHLPQNGYIGNKKALFYMMKHYCQKTGKKVFDVLPLTFHVSRGIDDPQWKVFQSVYRQLQIKKQESGSSNLWIIKPGESSNRGNGISVCHDLQDIRLRLKSKERNSDGTLRTFILQQYIENPLLYHDRKFDLRHYLLLTCNNGIFKAYWFEEGYVRTSSQLFSLKRGTNLFVHLTNDAVQKNSRQYGKFEDGNKISYDKLNIYIKKNIMVSMNDPFFDMILPKMKQIAIEAVKATYLFLDPARKQNNFELFGLDFMIDANLHPWLIEVNSNPCLETSCSLLTQIIPELIEQTFRIAVDPFFPAPEEWPTSKKLWLPDSLLLRNKYELIFDEGVDSEGLKEVWGKENELGRKIGKVQQESQVFESEGKELNEDKQ